MLTDRYSGTFGFCQHRVVYPQQRRASVQQQGWLKVAAPLRAVTRRAALSVLEEASSIFLNSPFQLCNHGVKQKSHSVLYNLVTFQWKRMNIVVSWEMETPSWDKSTLATLCADVLFNTHYTARMTPASRLKKIPDIFSKKVRVRVCVIVNV